MQTGPHAHVLIDAAARACIERIGKHEEQPGVLPEADA